MSTRSASLDLTAYEALTFDCYGTLIDWEAGLTRVLAAWAAQHELALSPESLLTAFAAAESAAESERPEAPYREILRDVHRRLAARFGVAASAVEADELALSVGAWPAFSDTAEALARLARRYRLVIVSNVDRVSFAGSRPRLGVDFDAVVTAEEVGAYKPDHRMFERAFAMLAELGVDRGKILHVAQSLHHDHVPAQALGLASVWVDRRRGAEGWGATKAPEGTVEPDLTVASMAELADLADRAHES